MSRAKAMQEVLDQVARMSRIIESLLGPCPDPRADYAAYRRWSDRRWELLRGVRAGVQS